MRIYLFMMLKISKSKECAICFQSFSLRIFSAEISTPYTWDAACARIRHLARP